MTPREILHEYFSISSENAFCLLITHRIEQQYNHNFPNTRSENRNNINVVIKWYQKDGAGVFTCIIIV